MRTVSGADKVIVLSDGTVRTGKAGGSDEYRQNLSSYGEAAND